MKSPTVLFFSSLLLVVGCTEPVPRGGPVSYPDYGAAKSTGIGGRVQMGGGPNMEATTLPSEPTTPPMTDKQFVRQAAQLGIAEVRIGELGIRYASDSALREYAQHLLNDHTKANQALAVLAARKGFDLPLEMTPQHYTAIDRLSRARARAGEFERLFQDFAMRTHQQALHAFRMAAQTSADPDIRAFALRQLPALEQHLAHAQRLDAGSAIGGSVGSDF